MDTKSQTVIPRISDPVANAENMAAIDSLVTSERFPHIVAWGKWLGFTPETVRKSLEAAETDNAPEGSLQKIDGQWIRREDIANAENLRQVDDLVRHSRPVSQTGSRDSSLQR